MITGQSKKEGKELKDRNIIPLYVVNTGENGQDEDCATCAQFC